jgi:FKBP-type peptidyl-prolyl cis-trans isomerase 2
MKLENNRFVSLVYTLHEGDSDGRVIEKVEETAPLTVVFGAGRLLPAFEANLSGLEEGSAFDFSLSAADAYGEKREEMVVSLPRNIFEDEGVLRSDYDGCTWQQDEWCCDRDRRFIREDGFQPSPGGHGPAFYRQSYWCA